MTVMAGHQRGITSRTIDEAKRLVEMSRALCVTAADLARESTEIRISIRKSLERKREVLRPR